MTTDSPFGNPSWKQLAAIPDSVLKQAVLRALDVTVPSAGISSRFQDKGLYVEASPDGGFVLMDAGKPSDEAVGPPEAVNSASWYEDGRALLKAARWPAGLPTGDALRHWLRQHGWKPASELKALAEPNDQTRTVI